MSPKTFIPILIAALALEAGAQTVYAVNETGVKVRSTACNTGNTEFGTANPPQAYVVSGSSTTDCGYTWRGFDIPSAKGQAGYPTRAYMASNYLTVSNAPNNYVIVQPSGTGLYVRNAAGGANTWIYNAGYDMQWASVQAGQRFARTAAAPVTSGTDTWYEIYLPPNCYTSGSTTSAKRTTGWVSNGMSSGEGPYVLPYGTASAPAASLSFSPNSNFGNLTVGTTSTRTLTLTNTGSASLVVSSITYPSGFSGAWNGTIAAGGSREVTVTFAPTAVRSYDGTLTVNSNVAGGTSTINCSGSGTTASAPAVGLNLNPANFGSVPVGGSGQGTLTITNTGSASLVVSSITYPSGFSGAWNGSIAAGGSREVTVTFSPTAVRSYDGTLTVNSNAAGSPHSTACQGSGTASQTYSISGTVTNPNLQIITSGYTASIGIRNDLYTCNVKILEPGTNTQVASATATGGEFLFTGLKNQNYDVLASQTSGGITYSAKLTGIKANTSGLQLKLPLGLIEAIRKYNDSLSNLSVYLEDLHSSVPVASYDMAPSSGFVAARTQLVNNQAAIEAMQRVLLAEVALLLYYRQAAGMNNQLVLTSSELAAFIFNMVEVSLCNPSLKALLTNGSLDLIKSTIEVKLDKIESPNQAYYHTVIDLIFDYLRGKVLKGGISDGTVFSAAYDVFAKQFVDREITRGALEKNYVLRTASLPAGIIQKAQAGSFPGSLQNAVLEMNTRLQQSATFTFTQEGLADGFRNPPGWVDFSNGFVNAIQNKACFTNPLFNLLDFGMDAINLSMISKSMHLSASRINGLASEASGSSPVALPGAKRAAEPSLVGLPPQKLQAITALVDAFETEYEAALSDVNANRLSSLDARLKLLIPMDKQINDSLLEALTVVRAAMPFSEEAGQAYITSLPNTLFTSPFVRYAHLAALTGFSAAPSDSLKSALNRRKTDPSQTDSLMLRELESITGVSSPESTAPYIAVNYTSIPLVMPPGSDSLIKVRVKNYGKKTAFNLSVLIKFDSAFVAATDSIFLGALAPNQVDSFTFSVRAPNANTLSAYSIAFRADSAITVPKGGTIFSGLHNGTALSPSSSRAGALELTRGAAPGRVSVRLPAGATEVPLKVYDSRGKKVHQTVLHEARTEIDLAGNPFGLYLFQVESGGEARVQKFVLSK